VVPAGGMGAFVEALNRAAQAAGVELRTGSPVARVCIDGDENGQRCSGVELEGGEVIRATRVVSSADPKTTFLKLVGAPQPGNRVQQPHPPPALRRLRRAPAPGPGRRAVIPGVEHPDGRIILAADMDSIEFAFDDAKHGGCRRTRSWRCWYRACGVPSWHRRGSTCSAPTSCSCPHGLKGGWNRDQKAELQARLMQVLERHAPGIGAQVLASELLTPADLEAEFRISGGHWHHAEPAIDQLLMMRPTYEAAQYRTPIEGLYLCGAGSHPGGDLTGNPGRNAAREILRSLS
jgi:phytoene dehydrogenase-like protein